MFCVRPPLAPNCCQKHLTLFILINFTACRQVSRLVADRDLSPAAEPVSGPFEAVLALEAGSLVDSFHADAGTGEVVRPFTHLKFGNEMENKLATNGTADITEPLQMLHCYR